VTRPFLLVQLSDPHIGADWGGPDPLARFAAAVESVGTLRPQPDAVLVSGDLADNATDEEYERLREVLARLDAPVHVVPGNHDERRALHRHFGVPGGAGELVNYSVDLGPVRLVVLDTTLPGELQGAVDTERLAWLDDELAAEPTQPTLLAMHHPPISTGNPVWDELGLPAADRQALGEVVARHRQVRRAVCGHVHRVFTGEVGGCPALVAPSTYLQARLDFTAQEIELSDDPAGFVVHAVVSGELISHVQPVS
jgi:Icc protein